MSLFPLQIVPKNYLLELRNAVNNSVGSYTWTFTERNLIRPNKITIGPVSVTSADEYRNVVLLSESFEDSTQPYVFRSDAMQHVLAVVHGEVKTTPPLVVSSSGTNLVTAVEDIGSDLLLWIDYDPARTLDQSFNPIDGETGTNLKYLHNRSPGASSLIFIAQDNAGNSLEMEIGIVGGGRGVRQESPNPSAWYIEDSIATNPTIGTTWAFHHTIVMPPTASPSQGAIMTIGTYPILGYEPVSSFYYYDTSNVKQTLNFTWIPLRAYQISISRELTGQNQAAEIHFRFHDLTTDVVVTETTVDMPTLSGHWVIGHPNYWFTQTGGPYLLHNGVDADDVAACRAWLLGEYNQSGSSAVTTWHQLYDTRKTEIYMNPPSKVMRNLTVEFQDHDGTPFDPADVVMHMQVHPS